MNAWFGITDSLGLTKELMKVLQKMLWHLIMQYILGGKDDLSVRLKSRKVKISPRDNIYLEFGLYAGILSPARSYF